jgi:hypothetical protein
MAAANVISPLILSVNQALTPGQNLTVTDQVGMTGNSKCAMLIDGVRIRVDEGLAYVTRVGGVSNLMGAIWAGLSVGRVDLTRGLIPMSLFGRLQDTSVEFDVLPFITPVGFPSQCLHAVWRFKKPLYISPQRHINVKLYWNAGLTPTGGGQPVTVNVTVSFFGRALPENYPVPATVYVPYMTSFVPNPFLAANTPTVLKSVPNDLGNPYREELRVTRFTGFCNSIITAGAVAEELLLALANLITVRMTEYRGGIVIRDQTSFGGAFDHTTRAWDVDAVLPPSGYYSTIINIGTIGGITAAGYSSQPTIALQGYRALNGRTYMAEVG